MECEVLLPHIARRGREMLQAMIAAAPMKCHVTEQYEGRAPWLMSYGLGHRVRRQWTQVHLAGGGKLIGWDMGYWDRDRMMRVTVGGDHPRALPDMPATRPAPALRDDADASGPIILVGMGRKSREQFGFYGLEWELRTLAAIRAAHPGRRVLYRPKKPEWLAGLDNADGEIADVLRGASLVVCRHSNVAVDACIAGVPVVCEDGAATALYGSDLLHPANPGEAERRRFLNNLAWWQWLPTEAAQAWQFLQRVCG